MKFHLIAAALLVSTAAMAEKGKGDNYSMNQCRHSADPSTKVDHCTAMISHSSNHITRERAFNSRGHAYMGLGRFAEAANDFTAVIRLNPKIAGYFDNRQTAYRKMGRLDDALTDANKAIHLAPTYSFVYGSRGNVFDAMGRYDLAIEDYTKAISLDSRNAGLFAGRGKIFAKAGQLNDAVADFTHALGIDMNMTAALRERGLAYKLLGNFAAARDDLNLFLPTQPNDEEIVQALKDMAPTGPSPAAPSPAPDGVDHMLFSWSGNGSKNTRPFSVDGGWEIQWESDRSIYIRVYDRNGNFVSGGASQHDPGSGSSFQPLGGHLGRRGLDSPDSCYRRR